MHILKLGAEKIKILKHKNTKATEVTKDKHYLEPHPESWLQMKGVPKKMLRDCSGTEF